MPQEFCEEVYCTLKELYDCNGIDGFDDLLEDKLGHGISDASWNLKRIEGERLVIEVRGDRFNPNEM